MRPRWKRRFFELFIIVIVLSLAALALQDAIGYPPSRCKSTRLIRSIRSSRLFSETDPQQLENDAPTTLSTNRNYYLRTLIHQDTLMLQTCIKRFQKQSTIVDLHAQVHFADAHYFQYYNQPDFTYDRVLYELIVSQEMLEIDPIDGSRRLTRHAQQVLGPSLQAQNTARIYNLTTQLDEMRYRRSWICSDFTRQELEAALQQHPTRTFFNSEILTSLLRPTTPTTIQKNSPQVRLFTNLFWSGKTLASLLRLGLWCTVPVPELSILLLDWSTLTTPRPGKLLSPLALYTLQTLLSLQPAIARKLIFLQILTAGQSVSELENDPNMVLLRNQRALEILKLQPTNSTIALLYGALHCPDLEQRLQQQGYSIVKTLEWRTAWTIQVPSQSTTTTLPTALLWLALYLGISGLDWLAVWNDVQSTLQHAEYGSALAITVFYFLRHAAFYFGLARFIIEWDQNNQVLIESSTQQDDETVGEY